jgi:hypothetical protein
MLMKQKLKQFYKKHKKVIIPGAFTLVIAGIVAAGTVYALRNDLVSRTKPASNTKPVSATVASPLTGREIKSELAERPVTGVMIENSPEARPQSGLNDAGVVFEAIAEGGITRFLALYQEDQPKLIGPVRSLRPYYLDWAMGFDSSVAHVGGSEEALQQARSISAFRDLDEFNNSAYFFRTRDRYAPHNMYTRTELLDKASKKKDYKESDFTSLERKKPKPAEVPDASSISVNFSAPTFRADYTYDKASNNYKRNIGGKPHLDKESSKQLTSDVIVIMKIAWSTKASGHSVYGTLQGGEAQVFQDGTVYTGTWSKQSREDQIKLIKSDGTPLKLNPGRTWIEALPTGRSVSFN